MILNENTDFYLCNRLANLSRDSIRNETTAKACRDECIDTNNNYNSFDFNNQINRCQLFSKTDDVFFSDNSQIMDHYRCT